MTAPLPRIGDILVTQGVITRPVLEDAAGAARGKIGPYLCAHDLVGGQRLARGLAAHQALPFVDFTPSPPDKNLFVPRDLPHYIRHCYVPYLRTEDGLLIATSEPGPELKYLLEGYYRERITFVATGPRDLADYFTHRAATTATRQARLNLRRKFRHLVADRTLLPFQLVVMAAGLGCMGVALAMAPHTSWQIILLLSNLFYLFSLYMKMELFTYGHLQLKAQRKAEPDLVRATAALTPESLPIYSILVPLYMESSAVMARLIANLSALDYPREKLDIKLICEADDQATLTALKALRPPERMAIITVPPSRPRTKPKACNVALQHIRGEYLVIYDAEDHPAADQLKRAVATFRMLSDKIACLQAPLNYYNRDENLLTQLFAIEYSALFRLNLPALQYLKLPIPLGGTSNHLRVSALQAAGGWDAFNVTEDADLGIRLAYLGYETRVLSSLTLEEAPITLHAWMKQRTRWIKGYLQTWFVYMREPAELKRRLGTPGYNGFQFFVGAPALTFLLAPFFWVVFFVSLTGIGPHHLYPVTQLLCGLSLLGGVLHSWLFARAAIALEGWPHMRRAMLVYPFYWLLHSVAAGRALIDLSLRPHYWAKTRHGVSRFEAGA